MKCRVMDKKHGVYAAPVWEMSFEPVSESAISEKIKKRDSKKYLSKRELFDLLEFVPAFVSMTTGIIPFKNSVNFYVPLHDTFYTVPSDLF